MNVTIETMINTCDYDTLLSFAQVIHAATNAQTEEQLRDIMKSMPYISFAHNYFDWGFGASHFWLKQRKKPNSVDISENRILIVKF